MPEFDDDTALVRREDGWHGTVTERWDLSRGPNGGYIAAFLVRAMAAESPFPHPLSMTTHFLSAPSHGTVRVTVEKLRLGRSHATLAARLEQESLVAASLATFGTRRGDAAESVQAEMPSVERPERCTPRVSGALHDEMPVRQRTVQLVPPQLSVSLAEPGPARAGGWVRLVDRDLDDLAVPFFMDSWPPAMLNTFGAGFAPTIELTVHWRTEPRTRWHLAQFRSRFLLGGYVEEDGELWGEDGRLVAASRQLALFVPG